MWVLTWLGCSTLYMVLVQSHPGCPETDVSTRMVFQHGPVSPMHVWLHACRRRANVYVAKSLIAACVFIRAWQELLSSRAVSIGAHRFQVSLR